VFVNFVRKTVGYGVYGGQYRVSTEFKTRQSLDVGIGY